MNKQYISILTTEEELEVLENQLDECPYCEPDGSIFPTGMICRNCQGKHYISKKG